MEQRRVVRVMNDIRALEAMADAMRVQAKNLKRSIKFAQREQGFPMPENLEVLTTQIDFTASVSKAVHAELNVIANAHGIHVPEDSEDDGIIMPLGGGGSKGGGG